MVHQNKQRLLVSTKFSFIDDLSGVAESGYITY